MIAFENFLTEKGYIMYVVTKLGTYSKPETYSLSSMGNICHLYIHKSEESIINKMNNSEDLTNSETSKFIIVGLSEKNKPPTLIHPRPNILVIKERPDGKFESTFNDRDDNMNKVLQLFSNEEVLEAILDRSNVLQIKINENGSFRN